MDISFNVGQKNGFGRYVVENTVVLDFKKNGEFWYLIPYNTLAKYIQRKGSDCSVGSIRGAVESDTMDCTIIYDRKFISLKNNKNVFWISRRIGKGGNAKNLQYRASKSVIGWKDGYLMHYPSINEASRREGIRVGHISEVCRGKRKKAGGLYWRYVNDDHRIIDINIMR